MSSSVVEDFPSAFTQKGANDRVRGQWKLTCMYYIDLLESY